MKNIVLLCISGMSTSLLVSNMRKVAKELNVDCTIKAVGEVDLRKIKEGTDVLLLGPQVRFMKAQFEKKLAGKDIPLEVINMQDYGMMNGEKVLDQALRLIDEAK